MSSTAIKQPQSAQICTMHSTKCSFLVQGSDIEYVIQMCDIMPQLPLNVKTANRKNGLVCVTHFTYLKHVYVHNWSYSGSEEDSKEISQDVYTLYAVYTLCAVIYHAE